MHKSRLKNKLIDNENYLNLHTIGSEINALRCLERQKGTIIVS